MPVCLRPRPTRRFPGVWSVAVDPPLVQEMAPYPGRPGEFLVLNRDKILRFDRSGAQLGGLPAPSKSTRIATDPTGSMPYLLVVSSNTKWTGAIDHTVTTDFFLHALDPDGREVWRKRFDPKVVSAPEPLVATVTSRPVVVLSGSGRILRLCQSDGTRLWDLPLWHHPGTVTPAEQSGPGGVLLAAVAPRGDMRPHRRGQGIVVGRWGADDGPRRLRAFDTTDGVVAVSLRQVFGRGPGVRHALTFFDGDGSTIAEAELPPDASPLSYAPIAAMDVDGTGRKNWVVPLGDGTIVVFSPRGEELARHVAGARLRSVLALPLDAGPDLLITATNRGLTAWRPVAGRIRSAP